MKKKKLFLTGKSAFQKLGREHLIGDGLAGITHPAADHRSTGIALRTY